MKTPLHKFSLLGVFLLTSYIAYSQSPPTGSPPASSTAAQAGAAWYRGGNALSNGNNIFGTMWNSPIYTVTNGVNRTKLNGAISYTINSFTGQQKNGALLIADGHFPFNGGFNYNTIFGFITKPAIGSSYNRKNIFYNIYKWHHLLFRFFYS